MDEHVPDKARKSDIKKQKKNIQLSTKQHTIFLETDLSATVQLEETGKRNSKTKKVPYSQGKQELSWHHCKCKNQSGNSAIEASQLAYK